MAEQKKTAKKAASSEKSTESAPATSVAEAGAKVAPAGSADQGPGTAQPEPDAEGSARTPESTLADGLNPPTDAEQQADPREGYSDSSTDHTYAAAGGQSVAGEEFDSLVDEKGKKVSPGSIFDDGDGTKGFVTVKKRVYERFYYPHTTEVASRLLFVEGQRVNRAEAARITETMSG